MSDISRNEGKVFAMPAKMTVRVTMVAAMAIAIGLTICLATPFQAHAAELQAASGDELTSQSTFSTQATVHKIKTAADWHKIGTYSGGTFKVVSDIKLKKLNQYLSITKNKKYVIDLNGHKVQTTYSGDQVEKRSAPLEISQGTVVIKDSSKKKKGVFRGTEGVTVLVEKSAKFYLKSGTINNDFLDYNNTACSAIMAVGTSKVYLNGGNVTGIVHGVFATDSTSVNTTGVGTKTYPYIRGKDGCGIGVASTNVSLTLNGGSFGTAATPDSGGWTQSGWYPVLDTAGSSLKTAAGCKYVDSNGDTVDITTTLFGMSKRLTTNVKSPDGYYTVYVVKA